MTLREKCIKLTPFLVGSVHKSKFILISVQIQFFFFLLLFCVFFSRLHTDCVLCKSLRDIKLTVSVDKGLKPPLMHSLIL